MNIKTFWDWLTTSRAFRLLQDQNEQLRSDIAALREENKRLLLAVSPTLRAIEPKEADLKPAQDTPKQERPGRRITPRTIPSWRNARQHLEFKERSQARRIERIMASPDDLP